MVIVNPRATAFQAARAMADNHIDAVLINTPRSSELSGIVTDRDLALGVLGGERDPQETRLEEIMSEAVVACDIGASLDDIVRLMRDNGVRRVPLMEAGRPVGLVTFDDLVIEGSVGLEALRGIITAQLEAEAPQKPAGMHHPSAPASARARTRALMRARARAEATYGRMIDAVATETGLEREPATQALLVATCMLCRRVSEDEALHLMAQLPSRMRPKLETCLGGPDRAVSTQAIEQEIGRVARLGTDEAGAVMRGVFKVLSRSVSPGQIAEVRGQLPEEMKELLPAAA
jgi:uncharacterized protein (DUF2267 family)